MEELSVVSVTNIRYGQFFSSSLSPGILFLTHHVILWTWWTGKYHNIFITYVPIAKVIMDYRTSNPLHGYFKIISKIQWWRWCKYKRDRWGGGLLSILVEAKFPAPFYSLICSSSNIVLLFNFCLHVFAFVFFLIWEAIQQKKGPSFWYFTYIPTAIKWEQCNKTITFLEAWYE